MNLTWHIFKKDLVRMRLVLGLWVIALGLEIFLQCRLLSSNSIDVELYQETGLNLSVFVILLRVTLYILVAALVLDDPLVGTRQMFWVTRPISGGRLLRAKLIGIVLLFWVLPFVVRLAWWIYCGFGWSELGLLAVIEFALLIVITVPAVALASLSGQSSRFLLYSLLMVAVIVLLSMAANTMPRRTEGHLLASRFIICVIVGLSSGVITAVWLYRTRRLMAAGAFQVGAIGLAVLGLFFWPWRLDGLWPENKNQLADTGNISAEIFNVSIFHPKDKNPAKLTDSVILRLKFKGVPDDLVLLSGRAEVELRWPDGTVIRQKQEQVDLVPISDRRDWSVRQVLALPPRLIDPETAEKEQERMRAIFQRLKVGGEPHRLIERSKIETDVIAAHLYFSVSPEIAAKIESEPPACSVSARIEAGRPKVLLAMPLREGAAQSGIGLRLQVLRLKDDLVVSEKPGSRRNHRMNLTLVYAVAPWITPVVYVVDRERSVIEPLRQKPDSSSGPLLLTASKRLEGSLYVPQFWRTDKWVDDPDWSSGTSLVAVTVRQEGGFNREIHTEQLKIKTNKTQ